MSETREQMERRHRREGRWLAFIMIFWALLFVFGPFLHRL